MVAGLALGTAVAPAHAAGGHLRVTVDGLKPGGVISRKLAFCVPNGKGEAKLGPNRNLSISWSAGPSGTQWFAGNPKMKGTYGGYDGPCPPWNDAIPHHYHFVVYALDVAKLPLNGDFSGPQAPKAMHGHILARGSVTGLYSVNPTVIHRLEKRR